MTFSEIRTIPSLIILAVISINPDSDGASGGTTAVPPKTVCGCVIMSRLNYSANHCALCRKLCGLAWTGGPDVGQKAFEARWGTFMAVGEVRNGLFDYFISSDVSSDTHTTTDSLVRGLLVA